MMGYLTTTYSSAVSNYLLLSTRYEFNINSFSSDLAFGFIFRPDNKGQILKLRFGFDQGLAVQWETTLGSNFVASMGVMVDYSKSQSYWRSHTPKSTVGLEIQYTS